MFSDSAGGQNKNFKFLAFCSWFAKVYNVEILHIFPIRGHSYGQCDRNFGLYTTQMKKRQKIQTAKEYVDIISSSRQKPQPFNVLWDKTILKKWSEILLPYFLKKPVAKGITFQIQQYRQIFYNPSGTVSASTSYSGYLIPFTFWKERVEAGEVADINP